VKNRSRWSILHTDRVSHRARLWKSGERPKRVLEGAPNLSI
jgi:hypothetical protein